MVCSKVPSQQQAGLNGRLWIIKNRDNSRVRISQTKIPLYLVPEEAVACWLAGKLSHGLVSLALRCWSRSLEAVCKGIMFWLQSFQAHLLDVNRITWTLLNWLIVANKLTIPVFFKWTFQWDYRLRRSFTLRSPFPWTESLSYFTPLCGKYWNHKHVTKTGIQISALHDLRWYFIYPKNEKYQSYLELLYASRPDRDGRRENCKHETAVNWEF